MSNVDVTTFPTPIAQATVREQPHNIEAEQGLLGAILINNRAFEKVSDFLHSEHFSDPIHGRIFEACGKLIERGQIANPVTLKPCLLYTSPSPRDGLLSRMPSSA